MYSTAQLAFKYLSYYLGAYNAKGHGVHSPFVFDFITNVLNDKSYDPCYDLLEGQRRLLLKNDHVISVQDYGAGSSVIQSKERKISAIAASSLKSQKYARLLHRIVKYYKPASILELGTSLGISTSYMAYGNPHANLYTLEGAPAIASLASEIFSKLGLRQVRLLEGEFSMNLPPLLNELPEVGLAFIDGNHRYGPTLDYFHAIRSKANQKTIMIFDDIHWSMDMERAWKEIYDHPAVTLSIDLFYFGIVFFDSSFLVKQHFPIRF